MSQGRRAHSRSALSGTAAQHRQLRQACMLAARPVIVWVYRECWHALKVECLACPASSASSLSQSLRSGWPHWRVPAHGHIASIHCSHKHLPVTAAAWQHAVCSCSCTVPAAAVRFILCTSGGTVLQKTVEAHRSSLHPDCQADQQRGLRFAHVASQRSGKRSAKSKD